jgi:hypothetical protein
VVLICPIRSFIDEEEHLHGDLVDTIPAAVLATAAVMEPHRLPRKNFEIS